MELSGINTRILQIIEYYHENSVENFAEFINIPEQRIRKLLWINEKTKQYHRLSAKILLSILENYPGIYGNWLLWGKGEMLLKSMFDKLCDPIEKEFLF